MVHETSVELGGNCDVLCCVLRMLRILVSILCLWSCLFETIKKRNLLEHSCSNQFLPKWVLMVENKYNELLEDC